VFLNRYLPFMILALTLLALLTACGGKGGGY
jgi:predicted small lipoprotein YifL